MAKLKAATKANDQKKMNYYGKKYDTALHHFQTAPKTLKTEFMRDYRQQRYQESKKNKNVTTRAKKPRKKKSQSDEYDEAIDFVDGLQL